MRGIHPGWGFIIGIAVGYWVIPKVLPAVKSKAG